jgi:signal peptidase I
MGILRKTNRYVKKVFETAFYEVTDRYNHLSKSGIMSKREFSMKLKNAHPFWEVSDTGACFRVTYHDTRVSIDLHRNFFNFRAMGYSLAFQYPYNEESFQMVLGYAKSGFKVPKHVKNALIDHCFGEHGDTNLPLWTIID